MIVASVQFKCDDSIEKNIEKSKSYIIKAAENGAKIVLLQELFMNKYFCHVSDSNNFKYAIDKESVLLHGFSKLSKQLDIVIIVSFFEKSNFTYYDSVIIFDSSGNNIGLYRKNHIPDGPGYEEKFYFSPSDIGFPVFSTKYGNIGIGVCWDQWFPEHARILALKGANMLFYPTAIGSEPSDTKYDSKPHWKRTIVGHSAANMIPIITANRVGIENNNNSSITFYGSSFITNCFGEIIAQADECSEMIIYAEINVKSDNSKRMKWGLFRDRRPNTYQEILSGDGKLDDT